MDWEYYNLMSDKDKEEYDYKFKNKTSNIYSFLKNFFYIPEVAAKLFFYLISFLMIMGIFLKDIMIKNDSLLTYQEAVLTLMFELAKMFSFIVIVSTVLTISLFIYDIIKNSESKWLEEKGYDIKFKTFDLSKQKQFTQIKCNSQEEVNKIAKKGDIGYSIGKDKFIVLKKK